MSYTEVSIEGEFERRCCSVRGKLKIEKLAAMMAVALMAVHNK